MKWLKRLTLLLALLVATPAYAQYVRDDCTTVTPAATFKGTCYDYNSGAFMYWDGAAWQTVAGSGGSGSGDVVGPSSSVDAEVALFSGTTGKIIKRAAISGIAKLTSGVLSAASAGSDYENPLTFNSPLSRSTNTISCSTCALTSGNLSQFASTTSAQLRGVLSDETGTGAAVFASTPTLVTPVLGAATGTSLAITGGDITIGGVSVCLEDGTNCPSAGSETDPVVGAINGIVKANGAGTISAASAGTDYVVPAGNVATATALAANGSNCSAGQFPLGVDASGASESCTALPTTISGTANQITASAATGAVTLSVPSSAQLSIAKITNLTSNGFVKTSGGDGTLSVDTASYITASSSDTLTNKTLDAEGTGNVVTMPFVLWLPMAGCTGTTAGTIWDLPTSNPMVATCTEGTNVLQGYGAFADGANTLSAQYTWAIPSDWVGNIDARFKWFTSATSGDVVWQLAAACVADAETNDPSFNAASTVTDTAKGTTLQTNDASITTLTVTGCAAGELMHLKVSRDPTTGADTLSATANLIGIELKYRRAM